MTETVTTTRPSRHIGSTVGYLRPIDATMLRQEGLDAAFDLLARRREIIKYVDKNGRPIRPGVEVVGIGIDNVRKNIKRLTEYSSTSMDSVCLGNTEAALRDVEPHDRRLAERGVRLRDVFDIESTSFGACTFVATNSLTDTRLAVSPVQMKIYDRRCVLIEGPRIAAERTALLVADRTLLSAALHYWQAVHSLSSPIGMVTSDSPISAFTTRQREITYLMADGHCDSHIAHRLGISVRTVRAEIAKLIQLLHARDRFGLGLRLGQLGFEHWTPTHGALGPCR